MKTPAPAFVRVCATCGTATSARSMPGNGWIEVVLWCAYIVPGLVYSIWRRSSKRGACPACGGKALVPLTSPAGAALVERYYPNGRPLGVLAEVETAPRPPMSRAVLVLVVVGVLALVGLVLAGLA